ncbi:uncharacterized protein LOC106475620 [Limulus polyphemus]|uniref:Uncharacterized protein LOC106475620 n=1 Tax=Limulus polyphemus TaxID=6850 RepID=A0ABM1BZU0_LIMPO|nr:uncharacterized protein LOC106475620 [Limulus polyphemus]
MQKKIKVHIDETSSYEPLKKDPTKELERNAKEILGQVKRKTTIPMRLLDNLKPSHSKTPELYGLPKYHKPDTPLRSIVPICNSPFVSVSWLLEKLLHPLFNKIPSHLNSTDGFLNRLCRYDLQMNSNTILFTLDVVSMYPSIPIKESISSVINLLRSTSCYTTIDIPTEVIENSLRFIFNNSYFKFDSTFYKQKKGIAMGNNIAVVVVSIFMHFFESSAPTQWNFETNLEPIRWYRYIDDIPFSFGIG